MISLQRDVLMMSLRPVGSFRPVPPASDRRVWDEVGAVLREDLFRRAENVLYQPVQPLTASMLRAGAAYERACAARRAQLRALAMGACVRGPERYVDLLVDLIWATLEQSTWALPDGLPQEPQIDLFAAETACELALCAWMLGPEISAYTGVMPRIKRELAERIFIPLADTSTRALCFSRADLPRAVDALMGAVLLMDEEPERRWLCMRHLISMLEQHLKTALPDGGMKNGLERQMPDVLALNNCLFMLSLASGGEVEIRDDPEFVSMAMLPVSLQAGNGFLLNPGGDSPMPVIDPLSLFRLGDSVRMSELCHLAAQLSRQSGSPAEFDGPLMHQLLNALYYSEFIKEPAISTLRPTVALPNMQLLSACQGPWFASLMGGQNRPHEGHLDVGDVWLFYQGKPVLIDPCGDPDPGCHSVPVVAGFEQLRTGKPPQEGIDHRFDATYTMLSLGIAQAYPPEARLFSWQRTLMLVAPGSVRLMDVMDFEQGVESMAQFRFVTPRRPEISGERVLLGDIELLWEGELNVSIEPLTLKPHQRQLWGDTFYRVLFTTKDRVPGGTFAFVFQSAKAVQ